MASSPAPAPVICVEKQRLVDAFFKAVSEYNRVQSAQVSALRNDDGLLFEDQIVAARGQRDGAKWRLLAHQREHGC